MQCYGLSDLTTVEVWKVTATVPASLLKFLLKCVLMEVIGRFCWERGRPVRIEREARRLVNPRKIASACGAVRTGRPRSQRRRDSRSDRCAQPERVANPAECCSMRPWFSPLVQSDQTKVKRINGQLDT